jgi:hypothetical protein
VEESARPAVLAVGAVTDVFFGDGDILLPQLVVLAFDGGDHHVSPRQGFTPVGGGAEGKVGFPYLVHAPGQAGHALQLFGGDIHQYHFAAVQLWGIH